jgi:DNA-binding CsgD family transcriptional regulator
MRTAHRNCEASCELAAEARLERGTVAARTEPQPSVLSARDTAICALYRNGATLKSIGERFGLSCEGVRKAAAKAGLSKRNAGLAARRPAKPPARKAGSACRRIYGCTVQDCAVASMEERRAFLQHRKNVRRDGVEWRLSLKEWRALWLASGKWECRGQGPSRYGMTRIDFHGPVKIGNVEIVTNREAVRRARLRAKTAQPRAVSRASITSPQARPGRAG